MENSNWSTAVAEFNQINPEAVEARQESPLDSRAIAAAERDTLNVSILSPREVQVLENIKEGMKNPEIAEALALSTKTVENHVRNILLKLGVKNRTQAVVQALRRSIITF